MRKSRIVAAAAGVTLSSIKSHTETVRILLSVEMQTHTKHKSKCRGIHLINA